MFYRQTYTITYLCASHLLILNINYYKILKFIAFVNLCENIVKFLMSFINRNYIILKSLKK